MGQIVAVHMVNTALQIMAARYPEELVRRPLPEYYDLRKLHPPLQFSDSEHETARQIFNQRTASPDDLEIEDISETWEPLSAGDQLQVITALFFMYGTKVGALKYGTGIQ